MTSVERALTTVIASKITAAERRDAARAALAAREAALAADPVPVVPVGTTSPDYAAEIAEAERAGDWRRAGALKLARFEEAR